MRFRASVRLHYWCGVGAVGGCWVLLFGSCLGVWVWFWWVFAGCAGCEGGFLFGGCVCFCFGQVFEFFLVWVWGANWWGCLLVRFVVELWVWVCLCVYTVCFWFGSVVCFCLCIDRCARM